MSEKLHPRLIYKTDPQPIDSCVIERGNVRITVLTDRLFRIETKPKKGSFIDEATQIVWFRKLDTPVFTLKEKKKKLQISTTALTLFVNTKNGKASVVFKNTTKKIPCENKDNLMGTARTLDMKNGKVKLGYGIMSKTGVSVIEDDSLILNAEGMPQPRPHKGTDKYIFAYGKDFRAALRDYFRLTGRPPLIPRFAFGNWWSRYYAYTQDEYLELMNRFEKENIPLAVATIDMDWHWVDVKKRFKAKREKLSVWGPGWTGYSWNTELFPDHVAMLKELHDKGLKVTMNLHPAFGVRFFEDRYEDMAKALDFDTSKKKTIKFDITSPKFVNAYFDVLHKPLEDEGVDFWWIDWQQGKKSKIKGLDPLWALNHYHFADNEKNGKRPLILSRYAGTGAHRYPLGFSGDAIVSWKSLNFQPYFTVNASNIGFTWWSHDIGGFALGKRSGELFLRWLQFGVFSPITRLHAQKNDLAGKEPWKFDGLTKLAAKEYLRLRHKLVPYIYTMNYHTHIGGRALCEPMYYAYPEEKEAYKVPNQYMFGTELIVCPITEKAKKKTKLASATAFIPEGRWTDIFTGYIYEGKSFKKLYREKTDIPVLIKAGGIVPMSADEGNGCRLPKHLEILVSRGNGSFEMFEDDGESLDYNLKNAKTRFIISEADEGYDFVIKAPMGDTSILPGGRKYSVKFIDINEGKVSVEAGGNAIQCKVHMNPLRVELPNLPYDEDIRISVTQPVIAKNPDIRQHAAELLSRIEGNNTIKAIKNRKLKKAKTEKKFRKKVKKVRFPRQVRKAILELYE